MPLELWARTHLIEPCRQLLCEFGGGNWQRAAFKMTENQSPFSEIARIHEPRHESSGLSARLRSYLDVEGHGVVEPDEVAQQLERI